MTCSIPAKLQPSWDVGTCVPTSQTRKRVQVTHVEMCSTQRGAKRGTEKSPQRCAQIKAGRGFGLRRLSLQTHPTCSVLGTPGEEMHDLGPCKCDWHSIPESPMPLPLPWSQRPLQHIHTSADCWPPTSCLEKVIRKGMKSHAEQKLLGSWSSSDGSLVHEKYVPHCQVALFHVTQ